MDLGNKIAIMGISGSGKSTLAIFLNQKLNLPLYHTDQFIWQNGWGNPKSNDEIVDYIDTLLIKDHWIIEGYMGYKSLPDTRLQLADQVIVLDYSRFVLSWHILKRHILYHGKNRPELPTSCTEKFDWNTVKRVWENFIKKILRRNLSDWIEHVDPVKLIVFKHPKQLQRWLKHIS